MNFADLDLLSPFGRSAPPRSPFPHEVAADFVSEQVVARAVGGEEAAEEEAEASRKRQISWVCRGTEEEGEWKTKKRPRSAAYHFLRMLDNQVELSPHHHQVSGSKRKPTPTMACSVPDSNFPTWLVAYAVVSARDLLLLGIAYFVLRSSTLCGPCWLGFLIGRSCLLLFPQRLLSISAWIALAHPRCSGPLARA